MNMVMQQKLSCVHVNVNILNIFQYHAKKMNYYYYNYMNKINMFLFQRNKKLNLPISKINTIDYINIMWNSCI